MGAPERPKVDKYNIVLIVATVSAFFLKLFLLSKRSSYLDPDEGYYLLLAQNLLAGKGYGFNGLPNIVMPPLLPLLISFFYLAFRNFQLSLAIISAASGTMLGILIYLLGRKLVPPLLALSASLLTLFVYPLNAFVPIAEPYIKTLYRGSDIINCLLVFLGLYFTIVFIEKRRTLDAGWTGLFLALSYLTRPEGVLLFIMVILCLCVLRLGSFIRVSYRQLALCLAVFILFAGPYVVYLKRTTGHWTLSGKVGLALGYRTSLLQVIKNENWDAFRRYHYSLNPDAMEMNDTYFGYHARGGQTQDISPPLGLKNALENLELYPVVPKTLLPLHLAILTVIGMVFSLARFFKTKGSTYLIPIILFPYSLAVAALSYPIPRHHLFLVPFGCLYSIIGLDVLVSPLPALKIRQRKMITGLVLFLIGIGMVNEHLMKLSKDQLNIPEFKKSLAIEKEIGNYLRGKNSAVVMSRYPNLAIRSQSDWQVMPSASVPQVIKFAAHKKVDYIVYRPEKRLFYRIIDLANSVAPGEEGEKMEFVVVERGPDFELVILRAP